MNKAERIKELEKELAELKAEVAKSIFRQKGVLYWVWDDAHYKYTVASKLYDFDSISGEIISQGPEGSRDCAWDNHELFYPQWIDIPDSLMEAPSIKGKFVIECSDGYTIIKEHTDDCYWDEPVNAENRIKRICILEAQS